MSEPTATVLITMYFQEPERAPQYPDMPPWHEDDNFDNVRKRAINAAWDMLMTRDLGKLRFSDLSKASRVTPAAIYHHFKTLDALGNELAVFSAIKLRKECFAALRGSKSFSRYLRALLEFARRRPNHFALLTSPRLSERPDVQDARRSVCENIDGVVSQILRRELTREESVAMRLQVLGAAALVAAKVATVEQALTSLVATFRTWRRVTRHLPRIARPPPSAKSPATRDTGERSFPEYPGETSD